MKTFHKFSINNKTNYLMETKVYSELDKRFYINVDIVPDTIISLINYLYSNNITNNIVYLDESVKPHTTIVDKDLYTIINIMKSWFSKTADTIVELEYKDLLILKQLYKENPNLLKDTIKLDINKRLQFKTINI
jgi:hypothetical protein